MSFRLPICCILVGSTILQELQKHLPNEEYRAHLGTQGTWEVSWMAEHIAKRSFLKYGGESGAAAQVLWAAWEHHTRRTGQRCTLPWLVAAFDRTSAGALAREEAAAALEDTALANLGPQAKKRGRHSKPKRQAKPAAAVAATAAAASQCAAEPAASDAAGPVPCRPQVRRRARPAAAKTRTRAARAAAAAIPVPTTSSSSSSSSSGNSSSCSSSGSSDGSN